MQQFEIVRHACSHCQYERVGRSCTWEPEAGAPEPFASEDDAMEGIRELVSLFPDEVTESDLAVREVGERYPIL